MKYELIFRVYECVLLQEKKKIHEKDKSQP